MSNDACPYCGEEISARAVICRHCHANIYRTPEERIAAAVMQHVMLIYGSPIAKPSGSTCEAWCYASCGNNKARLNECLRECEAAAAEKLVAESLHRELDKTIIEVIWGGWDIDPLRFEKSVRERFSRPRRK